MSALAPAIVVHGSPANCPIHNWDSPAAAPDLLGCSRCDRDFLGFSCVGDRLCLDCVDRTIFCQQCHEFTDLQGETSCALTCRSCALNAEFDLFIANRGHPGHHTWEPPDSKEAKRPAMDPTAPPWTPELEGTFA